MVMSKTSNGRNKQTSLDTFLSKSKPKPAPESVDLTHLSPQLFDKLKRIPHSTVSKSLIVLDSEDDSPFKKNQTSSENVDNIKENLISLNISMDKEPSDKSSTGGVFKYRPVAKALNFEHGASSVPSLKSSGITTNTNVSNETSKSQNDSNIFKERQASRILKAAGPSNKITNEEKLKPFSNSNLPQAKDTGSSSLSNAKTTVTPPPKQGSAFTFRKTANSIAIDHSLLPSTQSSKVLKLPTNLSDDDMNSTGSPMPQIMPKKLMLKSKPQKTSTQSIESVFQEEAAKNVTKPLNLHQASDLKGADDSGFSSFMINTSKKSSTKPEEVPSSQSPPKTSVFKFRSKASLSLKPQPKETAMESSPPLRTVRTAPTKGTMEKTEIEMSPVRESVPGSSRIPQISISFDASVIIEANKITKDLDSFDLERLKDEKIKFLESYYKTMNQIPMSFFETVNGFDKTSVLQLKKAVGMISNRIIKKQSGGSSDFSPNISIEKRPAINFSNNSREEFHEPCPNDLIYGDEFDDDQIALDEIMSNFNDNQLAEAGKSRNSFVDLTRFTPVAAPSTSTASSFNPRINMANQNPPSKTYNTEFVESFETDDDGFPMIDYSQLEDVVPSSSSSSYSSLSKQNQQKQSIESMIPDSSNSLKITGSDTMGIFHENVHNDGTTGQFDGYRFEFSENLKQTFNYTFGLKEFRPNQLQAINAVMEGNDCFILMPTGGGKSLCYQLPALISYGVTIVVSPLKSLIVDQVNKLKSLDINAESLSGEITAAECGRIYSDLRTAQPQIKLLYVTPEKISASPAFQEILDLMSNRNTLSRIVIDEAHCVSAWGHDFRPDYKKLGEFRRRYTKVPVMALTATATPRVRSDVVNQLGIRNCKWFLCSFNRPNLKYIVTPKAGPSVLNDIITLIKSKFMRVSGIIYCFSRKDCESVAAKMKTANIKAVAYHAGMTDKNREKVQKDWLIDQCNVICATIAFGMGIDKPDVRYVIHYTMPKSIEGYYQESGRAGRDGKLATCILYYNYGDKIKYMSFFKDQAQAVRQVSMDNLDRIVNFCENMVECRRALQLDYFGEHFTREQCVQNKISSCDNCSGVSQFKEMDVTSEAKKCIEAIRDHCETSNRTILQMVDTFKGAETKVIVSSSLYNTKYHGLLKTWDRSDIQRILHKLVIENFLREDIIFIREIPQSYIKIGKNVARLMAPGSQHKVKLFISNRKTQPKAKKGEVVNAVENEDDDLKDRCYHDLMEVARAIADEKQLAVGQVVNMVAIQEMSRVIPSTQEEMLKIPHVTKANFDKYGQRFLDILVPYAQQRALNMEDQQMLEAEKDATNSYESRGNWEDLGNQAGTSGSKRKSGSNWSGRGGAKRFKAGKSFRKKKSPAKKRIAAGGQKKARGGSSANLLPRPVPQF